MNRSVFAFNRISNFLQLLFKRLNAVWVEESQSKCCSCCSNDITDKMLLNYIIFCQLFDSFFSYMVKIKTCFLYVFYNLRQKTDNCIECVSNDLIDYCQLTSNPQSFFFPLTWPSCFLKFFSPRDSFCLTLIRCWKKMREIEKQNIRHLKWQMWLLLPILAFVKLFLLWGQKELFVQAVKNCWQKIEKTKKKVFLSVSRAGQRKEGG